MVRERIESNHARRTAMPRSIGFIGLGIMGFSMAKRLGEAGHKVTVYNRTASKGDALVALGAKKAATRRECAREGTLSILVGGEKADLEQAREVFNVMGKRITHCGPQGAGQTVKACNQILCALNMMGICEALHLARLSGIDQALVVEALTPGAGGSWALEKLGSRIAKGDFNPGFYVDLIQKDLRIVQDAAKKLGLPLQGTALAQKLFKDNQKKGEGKLGTQAMYKAVERTIKGAKKKRPYDVRHQG